MLEALGQSTVTWCILLVGLLFLVLHLTWGYLTYTKSKDPACMAPLPPGNVGWPLVGETFSFLYTCKNRKFYSKRLNKYGPVYVTHIFGKPMVRITGVDLIREVISKETKCLLPKSMLGIPRLIGADSILFSSGARHKSMRRVYQNAFNTDALESYLSNFDCLIQNSIKELCLKRTVPLHEEMKRLACHAVTRIMMGLKLEDQQVEDIMDISQAFVDGIFALPCAVPGSTYDKALKCQQRLTEFFEKYPSLGTGNEDSSVLSWILHAHTEGTTIDKCTVLRELLLAGQVTLSAAATTMIAVLHHHPQVKQTLLMEINQEFGSCNVYDDISTNRINSMQYLDWVVKEVLRLHPPAGGFFRESTETIVVGGYQIPKGWTISMSISDSQMLGNNLFSNDPQNLDLGSFKPERWDLHGGAKIGTKQKPCYIPFGTGSRVCVGKSYAMLFLKTLAVRLMQNCDYELLENNSFPMKMDYLPVHRPSGNLSTLFTRKDVLLL